MRVHANNILGILVTPPVITHLGLRFAFFVPGTLTVLAALSMGEVGYVGLPGNYGNGGYETSPSRGLADPTVGEAIIAGAVALLNK